MSDLIVMYVARSGAHIHKTVLPNVDIVEAELSKLCKRRIEATLFRYTGSKRTEVGWVWKDVMDVRGKQWKWSFDTGEIKACATQNKRPA